MKILYFITKSNTGDAQHYVYSLAKGAKDAGHEVVVCAGGGGPLIERLKDLQIRTHSIHSLKRDVSILSEWRSFLVFMRILRIEKPDILHLNSSKAGGIGSFAGRIENIKRSIARKKALKIIYTGHGWAFNEQRSDTERFFIGFFHWLTILFSHVVIAVSQRTAKDVMTLPFVASRVRVVHGGIEKGILIEKNEARKKLGMKDGLGDDVLVIGTVGELHRNKGHYYAIMGLAKLIGKTHTKVHYVICGAGEEGMELRDLVDELGIEQYVYFAGYHAHAAQLLSAFDVLLLPSVTEAFPHIILEAASGGIPVIATAVGGVPEIIDDMESGILIQSRNPGEVARAIQYFAENKEARLHCGEELKKRTLSHFSLEQMIEKTLAIYEEKEDSGL